MFRLRGADQAALPTKRDKRILKIQENDLMEVYCVNVSS